jgi:hypothetical protein
MKRRWQRSAVGLTAAGATVACALLLYCSGDQVTGGASETGNAGIGAVRIEGFDAPPPEAVEHVYLSFDSIEISGPDGWMTVDTTPRRVDFLQLVNGVTQLMADTEVPVASYTKLRINLGESHQVVIAGQEYPLSVPSGEPRGVDVRVHFDVCRNETTYLYLDFDLATSINWNSPTYSLVPSVKAYDGTLAGRIQGTVTDSTGATVKRALINAVGLIDSAATLTDLYGHYTLIAPAGTYQLSCSADKLPQADTVYAGVSLVAGQTVLNMDFKLSGVQLTESDQTNKPR